MIGKYELEQMTSAKIHQKYNVDWDDVIRECDFNGDGVIEFDEFARWASSQGSGASALNPPGDGSHTSAHAGNLIAAAFC